MQSGLYLIPWGLLWAAPRSAFCTVRWGWAGKLVGATGVPGHRWTRMGSQDFQALISFLVRFPKAKDKGEKVWHINTSWISEDKNRFWLYFSKNWGHCGLMTGWKAHHSIFFPIFFSLSFFFPDEQRELIFDTLYVLSSWQHIQVWKSVALRSRLSINFRASLPR